MISCRSLFLRRLLWKKQLLLQPRNTEFSTTTQWEKDAFIGREQFIRKNPTVIS